MAPGTTGEQTTDLIRSISSPTDEDEGQEPKNPRRAAAEAVADAPNPEKVAPEVRQTALDWLLSDEPDEVAFERYEIDVASPGAKEPKWIVWTLRAMNAEELKRARQMATGANRQQRRRADSEADLSEINLRIVTMATVDPDLAEVAAGKNLADPSHVLKWRFRNKPGIIDQLASKVLTISGYEEEAIRDAVEVRAAGN